MCPRDSERYLPLLCKINLIHWLLSYPLLSKKKKRCKLVYFLLHVENKNYNSSVVLVNLTSLLQNECHIQFPVFLYKFIVWRVYYQCFSCLNERWISLGHKFSRFLSWISNIAVVMSLNWLVHWPAQHNLLLNHWPLEWIVQPPKMSLVTTLGILDFIINFFIQHCTWK